MEPINPGHGFKAEWQRVWSDKLFTTALFHFINDDWRMDPQVDPREMEPRYDYSTDVYSGAYFYPFGSWWEDPGININSNYYIAEAGGSHDFKIGGMWRLENRWETPNARSGPIYYYDDGGIPVEVEMADWPYEDSVETAASLRNSRFGFWIQDNWTPHKRVTLNLGVRYLRQNTYYTATPKDDQALIADEWYPCLAGLFSTETVPAADIGVWSGLAPRLGVTFDLTGEGRTVLKASYGRYYNNFSVDLCWEVNPGMENASIWAFQDLDGNRILTKDPAIGMQELINEVDSYGGGSTVVDTGAPLPYSDQYQVSLEHQFPQETAVRILYVRKTHERLGLAADDIQNLAQAPFVTVPFQAEDPGAPGTMLNLLTTPFDKFGSDNLITEWPDSNNWNYDTINVGFEKRFTQDFTAQGSFDYQWREEGRRASSITTSPLSADPIRTGWYQNHSADVDTIQKTTNWGFKALARYQLPADIGLATNIRIQNGWNYARRANIEIFAGTGVDAPNAGPSLGTKRVFVEDLKNNRSDTVPLWDFRIDKRFSLGNAGGFTIMADVYNILNSNAVTNFNLSTGSFRDIIAALPPRTLKIGLRWTY